MDYLHTKRQHFPSVYWRSPFREMFKEHEKDILLRNRFP